MNAACSKSFYFALYVFLLARVCYNTFNFASAAVCSYHGHIVEECGEHNVLPQDVSDAVNATCALLETTNSLVLIVLILFWEKFVFSRFIRAVYLVDTFWIWLALVGFQITVSLFVSVTHTGRYKQMLGICTVLEAIGSAFLASMLQFIDRNTLTNWIHMKVTNIIWRRALLVLYDLMMISYVYRNIGLFVYLTALIARSLSLVKNESNTKDFTSFLLLMAASARGSIGKFFFGKFFEGRTLPEVCIDYAHQDDRRTEEEEEEPNE